MSNCIGCGHEVHPGEVCDAPVGNFMFTTSCGCKFERLATEDSIVGEYSFTETLGDYSQKATFKTVEELKDFIQQSWKDLR